MKRIVPRAEDVLANVTPEMIQRHDWRINGSSSLTDMSIISIKSEILTAGWLFSCFSTVFSMSNSKNIYLKGVRRTLNCVGEWAECEGMPDIMRYGAVRLPGVCSVLETTDRGRPRLIHTSGQRYWHIRPYKKSNSVGTVLSLSDKMIEFYYMLVNKSKWFG